MNLKKALNIAIKAMELQARKHKCNAHSFYAGCPGSEGEAKRYEEYNQAIDYLLDILEGEK